MTQPASFSTAHSGKSLGEILASAREARGIPIEQAARATRIRARRLLELEKGDLSNFSHPSYARLFMQDYAKYLGIPKTEIRPFLPELGSCGTEGYEYLNEIPEPSSFRRIARRIRPRRRFVPALVGVVLLSFAVLGGFRLWVTIRNLERIGGDQVGESPRGQYLEAKALPTVEAGPGSAEENPALSARVNRVDSFIEEDRALLFVQAPSDSSVKSSRPLGPQDL